MFYGMKPCFASDSETALQRSFGPGSQAPPLSAAALLPGRPVPAQPPLRHCHSPTPAPCRYGLVGRNGTGKTTLLRHLNQKAIKGIPDNCQILHVEQEVGCGVGATE